MNSHDISLDVYRGVFIIQLVYSVRSKKLIITLHDSRIKMAKVFVLCWTLYQVSGIVSETSFHQGMSAQRLDNSDETFSAEQIDSFSHYSWEDNVIPNSDRSDLDLNSINLNILRLQQLISQQSDLIQFLISGQDELSKENSKWIKRYKSTRKYLRKLNRACVFRPSGTETKLGQYKNHVPLRRQASKEVVSSLLQTESSSGFGIVEKLSVKPKAHISEFSKRVDKKMNTKANKQKRESKLVLSAIIKSLPLRKNESVQLNGQVKMEVGKLGRPLAPANYLDPLLETVPFKNNKDASFEIDLTNGQIQGKDSRITWEENLVFGQHVKCGLLGVVKIDLHGLDFWSIVVDMRFERPTGSVFNIATSPSRNKTHYEIRGYDEALEVSCRFNNDDSLMIIYHEDKSIASRLTLLFNDKGISKKMASGDFKLINDTADISTESMLYLSMNRVIGPGVMSSSSGLCNVKFNWLNQ